MSGDDSEFIDWDDFARIRAELGADFIRILGYFREDGEKAIGRIEDAMRRRDTAGLVIPAHTLKTEARQFGLHGLGDLSEEIEHEARRALESHLFPDQLLPPVTRLRPLYEGLNALLEAETNPLVMRRAAGGAA